MKKIVSVNNQAFEFNFNEAANCWSSKLPIDNIEIEIEIDFGFHKEPEVDWDHLANFLEFISVKDRLTKLVNESSSLITELGMAYFKRSLGVKDWRMVFKTSIFYNGKIEEINSMPNYSFSLLFDFIFKKENVIDGDAYGLYLIDLENLQIVGARRHSC